MYRPQYVYRTPAGFEDKQFHLSFDQSNTPMLSSVGQTIAAGAFLQNIPLQLQRDAIFMWRGIEVNAPGVDGSSLLIQFKDAYGNYLSDVPIPVNLYAAPIGNVSIGNPPVALEPELFCPAGSNLWVYLQNITAGTLPLPRITIYGVKRHRGKRAA
jgi:hypothetical protein